MLFKPFPLSRCVLPLFMPLLALGALTGCSGGSSGNVTSKPAPVPGIVAQETPVPTFQSSDNNRIDLKFSPADSFNGQSSAFQADSGDSFFRNSDEGFDGNAFWTAKQDGIVRRLNLSGPTQTKAVEAGDELLAVGPDDPSNAPQLLVTYTEESADGSSRIWESSGGQLKILSASDAEVKFSLEVKMSPQSKDDGATGNFTLSGSGQIGK